MAAQQVHILSRLEKSLRENCHLDANQKILLAASSGLDSTVLAEMLLKLDQAFELAHMCYQLREESLAEAEFLENWCKKNGIPYHEKKIDLKKEAGNTQELARKHRYQWFSEILNKLGISFLMTAHHADDQVETVIRNLASGSSIRGLRGILYRRDLMGCKVLRPLLEISKSELLEFARENGISWMDDSSNFKNDYQRNQIRNILIPKLEEIQPGASKNISSLAQRLADVEALYDSGLKRLQKRCIKEHKGHYQIFIRALEKERAAQTLLFEFLKAFGFNSSQVTDVWEHRNENPGAIWESKSHQLFLERNHFCLLPKSEVDGNLIYIKEGQRKARLAGTSFEFYVMSSSRGKRDSESVYLKMNTLEWPLKIRFWEAGDYFKPEGFDKKKKIKKFLTDEKVPVHQKSKIMVLQSGERIAWVCGMRRDARFVPGNDLKHEKASILKIKMRKK
jgi:tRNA(Ile)-lysidine synthase